jgi:hypothetical protein
MELPYLIVRETTHHGDPCTTAIGPFENIHRMLDFARAYRRLGDNGKHAATFGRSDKPANIHTVNPDDLFPWHEEQIPACPDGIVIPNT